MMSQSAPVPDASPRIVIHHLSDLHYQRVPGSRRDDPLVQYSGYLDGLPPERRPSLIIITGDLTATGAANDLAQVATFLRVSFPTWASALADHVFLVPGPHDVNWEGADAPSLAPFYEAFHDFGLPSPRHAIPEHGVTPRPPLNCVVYALDTCYSLDEMLAMSAQDFEQYASECEDFIRRYRETQRSGPTGILRRGGDRKKQLAELREPYLKLTESSAFTLLDAGRVHPSDLATFRGWTESAGQDPSDPLKILVTHHPLAVQPETQPRASTTQPASRPFEQLARLARGAGFHLALHGHIHKPQVLSDLSLLQGPDARHPLRQIGAGSLGDGGTLNEITATYSRESEPHHWRLEIRTITLQGQNRLESSSFVLLNRTEDMPRRAEDPTGERERAAEFDRRVRTVMRQFSEGVHATQSWSTSQPSALLPQSPLLGVESIIREVVFPGYALRVRLFLKDRRQRSAVPKLSADYLEPAESEGTGPVTYPDSLAALALVLGRPLSFPLALDTPLDESDHAWLARSGKSRELLGYLNELVRDPGSDDLARYQRLRDKLEAWLSSADATAAPTGADFYRPTPLRSSPLTYPEFICVPFPQRSATGTLPQLPEVAVLVVSVKAAQSSAAPAGPNGKTPGSFTPERIAMLQSLSDLVGVVLITSSALGKPKGWWDDRL